MTVHARSADGQYRSKNRTGFCQEVPLTEVSLAVGTLAAAQIKVLCIFNGLGKIRILYVNTAIVWFSLVPRVTTVLLPRSLRHRVTKPVVHRVYFTSLYCKSTSIISTLNLVLKYEFWALLKFYFKTIAI